MQNNLKNTRRGSHWKKAKTLTVVNFSAALFLVFIFLISFSSAELQLGLDGTTDGVGINFIPDTEVAQNASGPAANQSDVWITNIGNLDNVNSTQFENNGETLSIITSWLESFGNNIWCKLTGCTMTGDLTFQNAAIQNPNYIQFNTTWTNGQAEGRLQWNIEDGTLEVGMPGGDVNLQIGQEMLIRVKNEEAITITNGEVVYASSAIGNTKYVKLANAANHTNAMKVVGIATEDIAPNSFGFITVNGLVRDFNTSSFEDGQLVYLDTIDGQLTGVPPTAPNTTVIIGIIVRPHATEGIMYARIGAIGYLEELSNILTSNLTTEDVLVYNSTSEIWNNIQRNDFTDLTVTASEFAFDGIKLRNLSKNSQIDGSVMGIMMTNPPNQELPHLYIQSGGSGQFSGMVRSWGIIDEQVNFLNSTNRTDCQAYFDVIGEELKIDCNTTTTGADFFVSDDSQFVDEVWMTDTDDEWHFMTRELELLDENRKDTVISGLNFSLVNDNLTIIEKENRTIVVNLHENTEILNRSTDSIILTTGTNTTPIFNHVYYQNGNNTILAKSTSQEVNVGDVAFILMGDDFDYGSISGSANQFEFTRKSYFDSWYRGEVYQEGFNIDVSSTQINFSTGTMWLLMDSKTTTTNQSTTKLAIEIHSDGTFHQHINNINNFDEYGTGELIANNKYFNFVCGIANTIDTSGRMFCMVQDKPSTEHTKLIDAETDTQYVNYFPGDPFVKKLFTPIVQVVMQRAGGTNTIQTLTTYSGNYIDLRGRNLGTGGSPPVPGITSLSQLTIDTNLEMGTYNVTAEYGFFEYIGELLNRITTLFVKDININGTINNPDGKVIIEDDLNVTGLLYGNGSQLTGITFTDTNETTRVNTIVGTDCGTGNYSYGFDSSGNIQCREDEAEGTAGTRVRTSISGWQSMTNNADTIIVWNVDNFDTLNEYDNTTGKFTATEAGYYKLDAKTRSSSITWGNYDTWVTKLYVNGNFINFGQNQLGSAGTYPKVSSLNTIYYLNVGDYVEFKIYQNSGVAVNIQSGTYYNYMSIYKI